MPDQLKKIRVGAIEKLFFVSKHHQNITQEV